MAPIICLPYKMQDVDGDKGFSGQIPLSPLFMIAIAFSPSDDVCRHLG
jgi:hypothetical protein